MVHLLQHCITRYNVLLALYFLLGLEYIANALTRHRDQLSCGSLDGVEVLDQNIHKVCDDLKCAVVLLQHKSNDHVKSSYSDELECLLNAFSENTTALFQQGMY